MLDQSNEVVEQPKQDSTPADQGNEQAEKTAHEIDLDGEKVTLDQIKEWKSGHMRQEDYTRKTQELAAERNKLARNPEPTKEIERNQELEAATKVLKESGFVTKEDLALLKAQEEDAKRLKKLIKANPELKIHEEAIKRVGMTDTSSWEDIVTKYGFLQKDKLAKAKAANSVVGTKSTPVKEKSEKSISNMSTAEYEKWKKENLGSGKFVKRN